MDVGALFEKMAVDLADRGVEKGESAGLACLTRAGEPFACLHGEAMAFRLLAASPSAAEARGLPGATEFAPDGQPRPDWVEVPVTECNEWESLAVVALGQLDVRPR